MPLVRRFRKPCYNLSQRRNVVAVERMVRARLGVRWGDTYNTIFPLGMNFYLMHVEPHRVEMTQCARNATYYDTMYHAPSDAAREHFNLLGAV